MLAARPVDLRPVDGIRVGVLRRQVDDSALAPGVRARVHDVLGALDGVDVDFPELDLVEDALAPIILREAWLVHCELFEREADRYGPGTRALLEQGSRVGDDEYEQALAAKQRVATAFERVFADVDVLAGPTVAYPAPAEDPPVGTPEGDLESRYTAPYNLAGVPAVSVPCGLAEGALPAGLQLAAARGEDALLLSFARRLEEVGR